MKANIIALTIVAIFVALVATQRAEEPREPRASSIAFETEQAKLEAARRADPSTRPHAPPNWVNKKPKPVGVNDDGYDRLEMGMTHSQACEVLGFLFEEIASNSTTKVVQWTSNAGQPYYVIMATFADNRLVAKSR